MILASCLLVTFIFLPTDTCRKNNGKQLRPDSGHEIICGIEEEMATFPGGEKALVNYLERNIKYPAMALKAKVSGTIFVQFTVTKAGLIRDVHTVGTYKGYGMENEAIRVVCKMPAWKPAKMGGKPTDVWFNLPIRFVYPPEKEVKKQPH